MAPTDIAIRAAKPRDKEHKFADGGGPPSARIPLLTALGL
jgi:hypothetical protein